MTVSAIQSQFGRFSAIGTGDHFPNPFYDMASLAIPNSMRNALYWAEYIFNSFGIYRMAMERIISYFLTSIDIAEVSSEERDKYEEFIEGPFRLMGVLHDVLRDRMAYGNSFSSFVVPFSRWLQCPKCGATYPLAEVYNNKNVFHFEWKLPQFIATCPHCRTGSGYKGPWLVKDHKGDIEKKLKIKRWNVHEIELLHDPGTDDVAYFWRIPEDYKNLVRKGNLFHLERVSFEVLKAIENNQVFRFDEDAIFHMKEPTIAGVLNRGWGIPRIITSFRQIWYVQVLRRYNEAIALDYVIPFRVVTPAPRGGSGVMGGQAIDPMMMWNMGDFKNQVSQMIRRRRRDPAAMQILPFPVEFQMFGADANKLAPRDLLDQGLETLLSEAGTPVELFNGTLQLQVAPVALRLFESTFRNLVSDANLFLGWAFNQIARLLNWESAKPSLRRVTMADDVQTKMAALQLMVSQILSGTTGLEALGFDWKKEQRQLGEEAKAQAEIQARIQEEMEQSGMAQQLIKGPTGGPLAATLGAMSGQGQPGAAPAGGGGGQAGGAAPVDPNAAAMSSPVTSYINSTGANVPQSPQDILAAADAMANELLGLPYSVRRSELAKLKTYNAVMHGQVVQKMDEIRRQARSQGGAQQMQAMYGQA